MYDGVIILMTWEKQSERDTYRNRKCRDGERREIERESKRAPKEQRLNNISFENHMLYANVTT